MIDNYLPIFLDEITVMYIEETVFEKSTIKCNIILCAIWVNHFNLK